MYPATMKMRIFNTPSSITLVLRNNSLYKAQFLFHTKGTTHFEKRIACDFYLAQILWSLFWMVASKYCNITTFLGSHLKMKSPFFLVPRARGLLIMMQFFWMQEKLSTEAIVIVE